MTTCFLDVPYAKPNRRKQSKVVIPRRSSSLGEEQTSASALLNRKSSVLVNEIKAGGNFLVVLDLGSQQVFQGGFLRDERKNRLISLREEEILCLFHISPSKEIERIECKRKGGGLVDRSLVLDTQTETRIRRVIEENL